MISALTIRGVYLFLFFLLLFTGTIETPSPESQNKNDDSPISSNSLVASTATTKSDTTKQNTNFDTTNTNIDTATTKPANNTINTSTNSPDSGTTSTTKNKPISSATTSSSPTSTSNTLDTSDTSNTSNISIPTTTMKSKTSPVSSTNDNNVATTNNTVSNKNNNNNNNTSNNTTTSTTNNTNLPTTAAEKSPTATRISSGSPRNPQLQQLQMSSSSSSPLSSSSSSVPSSTTDILTAPRSGAKSRARSNSQTHTIPNPAIVGAPVIPNTISAKIPSSKSKPLLGSPLTSKILPAVAANIPVVVSQAQQEKADAIASEIANSCGVNIDNSLRPQALPNTTGNKATTGSSVDGNIDTSSSSLKPDTLAAIGHAGTPLVPTVSPINAASSSSVSSSASSISGSTPASVPTPASTSTGNRRKRSNSNTAAMKAAQPDSVNSDFKGKSVITAGLSGLAGLSAGLGAATAGGSAGLLPHSMRSKSGVKRPSADNSFQFAKAANNINLSNDELNQLNPNTDIVDSGIGIGRKEGEERIMLPCVDEERGGKEIGIYGFEDDGKRDMDWFIHNSKGKFYFFISSFVRFFFIFF